MRLIADDDRSWPDGLQARCRSGEPEGVVRNDDGLVTRMGQTVVVVTPNSPVVTRLTIHARAEVTPNRRVRSDIPP